ALVNRNSKTENVQKPKDSRMLCISNTNAIKNAKITSERIEAQKNEDHLQILENEQEEKE
ncbi:hypothetical protein LOAG_16133, partial [Loa loa]